MTQILYKVTDQNHMTRNNTQWGHDVSHGPTSGQGELCSSGWLHAYKTAKDAALMHKHHVFSFNSPVLWEAEGTVEKDDDLKIGTRTLKTIKIIPFPEITPDDIDVYLDNDNWEVCYCAIKHPNATSQQIDKALNDKDSEVRKAAIKHPNASSQNIDKALNDRNWEVRYYAIQHPNATSKHIDKALNDKDWRVRRVAIQHPNATKQHIDKGLNDQEYCVREVAIKRLNTLKDSKK